VRADPVGPQFGFGVADEERAEVAVGDEHADAVEVVAERGVADGGTMVRLTSPRPMVRRVGSSSRAPERATASRVRW
jgi:hypothetical protein